MCTLDLALSSAHGLAVLRPLGVSDPGVPIPHAAIKILTSLGKSVCTRDALQVSADREISTST
jgi:hypothetical protein